MGQALGTHPSLTVAGVISETQPSSGFFPAEEPLQVSNSLTE